jgi:hypothetical protein
MSRTTKQKAKSRTVAVSLPDPEQPTTAMQSGTVRHVQAVAAAPAHSIPQALDYAPSAPPPPAHSIPQALNYDDVARVLGVTVRHVQAIVAAGKLHPIPNLGRLARFAPTEVFRFMNATPAAVEATPA